MKNYLKLVNFEFNRFLKIYLVLLGITIVSQIAGVIITSKSYLNQANEMMHEEGMSLASFLEQFGKMSFSQIGASLWFIAPIAISIVTLIIYVFFIWYRDWFAKNTFIYRLLTIPTARLNVYLAKATTIFLMVLGLVALQIVLLPVESTIMEWMVPVDLRLDLTLTEVMNQLYVLAIIIPNTLVQFIRAYLFGFMAVFVLFTIILMDRSWKWKGVILGILYGVLAFVIAILPWVLQFFILTDYFYPIEIYFLQIVAALVVSSGTVWIGHLLLKNKVTV